MLNDYKYAIRAVKQAANYNKITNYLILHIRKMYEHGGDITNAIENQKISISTHLQPNSRYQQLLRQWTHPLKKT